MRAVLATAALLVVSDLVQSDDCDYGEFELTSNGTQCMFDCENNNNHVAIDTLEFNFIAEQCDQVMYAARNDYCDSLDDLVWPDSCGCPYCKCTDVDTETSYNEFHELIEKTCYGCACSASTGISSTDVSNIAMCSRFGRTDDAYNWNDFECPPVYCQDDDGNDRLSGESWYEDVGAGEPCNKFCYCGAGGAKTCETGFENIAANSAISTAFWADSWDAHVCVDTPEDLLTLEEGTYCYGGSYVKCGCGGRAVGDVWYVSYENPSDVWSTYQECERCECKNDHWRSNASYADCDSLDNTYGDATCPGTTNISCHDGYGTSLDSSISSSQCISNEPEGWCEVELPDDDDEYNEFDWRCNNSPFCATYGGNGECFYYEYEVTYEDCDGVTKTESDKEYTYCCNTDDCNFVEVDKATCTKSTELSNVMQAYWECAVNSGVDFDDDCSPFDEEEISCNNVVQLYGEQATCVCAVYSQIWADANDDWKPWIKDVIDGFMTSFSGWNEPLGCNIDLTCDVTTEGGEITGPGYNPSSASQMGSTYALLFGLLVAVVRF